MSNVYREIFADADNPWKPGPPLTPEREAALDERRRIEREELAARAKRERQTVRYNWQLTVGKLKTVLADLPDDMPVIVHEELGIRDVTPQVDDDPYDIAGPVLDMGGW